MPDLRLLFQTAAPIDDTKVSSGPTFFENENCSNNEVEEDDDNLEEEVDIEIGCEER